MRIPMLRTCRCGKCRVVLDMAKQNFYILGGKIDSYCKDCRNDINNKSKAKSNKRAGESKKRDIEVVRDMLNNTMMTFNQIKKATQVSLDNIIKLAIEREQA